MKRLSIIFIMCLIFGFSFMYGYYLYNKPKFEFRQMEASINNDNTNVNNIISFNKDISLNTVNITSAVVEASNNEEKISPNAILIIKKYYKECGHTITDEAIIPEEMVNRTKSEVQDMYPNWDIQMFSEKEVVLFKELNGICNEHYILKPLDDVIAIYNIDEYGDEKFQEKTSISLQYLTEDDLTKLSLGIRAVGKVQLNSILEDYE